MSARSRTMRRHLDADILASDLGKLTPRANQFGDIVYAELLHDLRTFGIVTRAQLRRLLSRHRLELRRIDREPFDELNARIQRRELGDARFTYLQRRGIFYNSAGLVRLALELEHGERYRSYMLKQYHAVETETPA